MGAVTARLDILYRVPSGVLLGIEIKTGENPYLSLEQSIVYPHAILGAASYTGARGAEIGVARDARLPPVPILVIYAEKPGTEYKFLSLTPEQLDKSRYVSN